MQLRQGQLYVESFVQKSMARPYATRIAEVEDAGEPDEHELPEGNDHGYIWRLDSYWRLEEKEGGVYVQVESIALSRTIPWTIARLVNPLVRSIPRNVLSSLLRETRAAVEKAAAGSVLSRSLRIDLVGINSN